MTCALATDSALLTVERREDIWDLCREEEKRLEKMTREPKQIIDASVNGDIHLEQDVRYRKRRASADLQMDQILQHG